MSQVTTIKPHINTISAPDELRELPGWLMWRYEQHDGEAKQRKVPYYTNGSRRHGVQGRPEDRSNLTTFGAARAAAARKGYDGVGLALMPEWGITALDFDNCIGKDGVLDEVERMIAGTYAEWSPSGKGVRAFVRGNLGDHKDFSGPFGFETFSTKGFVTFTGQTLDITELLGADNNIADPSDELKALITKRFTHRPTEVDDDPLTNYAPPLGLSDRQIEDALDVLDPDMGRDHWRAIGMAIRHEKGDEGFDLWHDWSARAATKYPGEQALRQQWESFRKTDGKLVTARTLVKMANNAGAHLRVDLASEADITDAKADKPNRFTVVSAGEFSRGERPGWVIKGVLPRAELVVLFGESGSGKSFLSLDLAAAIVRGVEWRGHKTNKGRVVYIAAEGGGGFRNRLSAYQIKHGIDFDDYDLGIIHAAPNFLEKADAVDIGRAILAAGRADVIFVDTFAQVMPGANENAGEDVGKALQHCRVIHKATGAVVVLVHHSGKDATKGARGWSGLRAAADAEIEVSKTLMGRLARISKQKDGDDNLEWGFDLETVPVGIDEDGDVVDSCVVIEAEVPTMHRGSKRALGEVEKLVMQVMAEITESQVQGIEVEPVIERVKALLPAPPEPANSSIRKKRDTRPQRVKRALSALCTGDDAPFFLEADGTLSVV